MKYSNHPTEAQLALYSGHDLGFWEQRKVRSHVNQCEQCQTEVRALNETSDAVREVSAELPADLNWTRYSQEMTGNIRVGLAAGECIAGFEKVIHPTRPRFILHTALVVACATLVVVCTLWLNLPRREKDHLMGALNQVRWDRIGATPWRQPPVQDVVLEATPAAIEVKSGSSALTLLHPGSVGATVSVNMQDSAGVRYVDSDTGQVTLNKVYYAQ